MKYLKNNDIIIILVLFVVFCLFLFKSNIEGFQTTRIIDPVETKKQNKKDLILNFIRNVEFFINKLQIINTLTKEIIKILFDNKYDYKKIYSGPQNITIQTTLNNLFSEYEILSNIEINDNQDSKDLKDSIDKFKEIHNDVLFKNYIELFKKKNSDVSSSKKINICPNGIVLDPPLEIFNFFTNLKNSSSVIVSSNPLSVQLIDQNLKQIKSDLSLINFKKNIREEINTLLDNYIRLLGVIFNNRLNFDIILILNNIVDCNPKTKDNLLRNHDSYNQHLNFIDFEISNISLNLATVKDMFEGDVFIQDDELNFFEISKKNMELEQKFCDKLGKLDKPKKNNLIFKRFSEEVITKKKKYIKDLNKRIEDIYSRMTEKEINEYNLNRIRIDDQASKQYEAIKKGISNIKNKNKIKINLY